MTKLAADWHTFVGAGAQAKVPIDRNQETRCSLQRSAFESAAVPRAGGWVFAAVGRSRTVDSVLEAVAIMSDASSGRSSSRVLAFRVGVGIDYSVPLDASSAAGGRQREVRSRRTRQP
jgi:hypothetical protein